MRQLLLLALCTCLVGACRPKDPVEPSKPIKEGPSINFQFQNVVAGQPLVLTSGVYTSANGDNYSIKTYRYFVSNITLISADGTEYSEPESYHLIDQEKDSSLQFRIKGLPAGSYTGMRFLIGVDSLRNVSGAQTGALDPASGMFWDWDTGYVMAMLEGNTTQGKSIVIHMGGFKDTYNVLRWVSLSFPNPAVVSEDTAPTVHITSDIAEWFKTPTIIDLSSLAITGGGKNAAIIADNYVDMFKVDHVD